TGLMRPQSNNFARGFTLLELLVVLVIVAVMAGLLVFGAQDSPARQLQREARALAALINTAADEAVSRSIEIGLVLGEQGYRFVYFDPETKRWQPLQRPPLAEHRFDERYAVGFQLDGERLDENARKRLQQFIASGVSDTEADLSDDDNKPLLLMMSSGEITPFVLTLTNDVAAYTLRSDGFNAVEVEAVVDDALSGQAG